MLSKIDVCIVIPVYNEEECIEQVLNEWTNTLFFLRLNYRLIIVNDGSKDGTKEILNAMAQHHPYFEVYHCPNGGHGKAIHYGYQRALEFKPSWIFQVDSDNQFYTDDFSQLWEARKKSDFILGIRKKRNDPLSRLVITRFLRYMLSATFLVRIHDANIPFRLIKASVLATLLPLIPASTFAPNIWLAVLAKKTGMKTGQIVVKHKARETGFCGLVSRRLMKACLNSVKQLWQLRFNLKYHPEYQRSRINENLAKHDNTQETVNFVSYANQQN